MIFIPIDDLYCISTLPIIQGCVLNKYYKHLFNSDFINNVNIVDQQFKKFLLQTAHLNINYED